MKKALFSFLLLFFFAVTVNAQTEKGTWLFSGNLNYSIQKYNYSTYQNETITLTAQPQVGLFVAKNLVVGIGPVFNYNYATNNEPSAENYSTTATMLGSGLFVRYYFMFNQQFGLYPELDAAYSAGLNHNPAHSFDVAIVPSLVFFPVKTIGVSLGLGNIGYMHQKDATDAITNTFGLGANGNSITLGVSYHFAKR